jgi:hypothetical protein
VTESSDPIDTTRWSTTPGWYLLAVGDWSYGETWTFTLDP